MNKLGMRQDELNEKVDLTNELVVDEQIEQMNWLLSLEYGWLYN